MSGQTKSEQTKIDKFKALFNVLATISLVVGLGLVITLYQGLRTEQSIYRQQDITQAQIAKISDELHPYTSDIAALSERYAQLSQRVSTLQEIVQRQNKEIAVLEAKIKQLSRKEGL